MCILYTHPAPRRIPGEFTHLAEQLDDVAGAQAGDILERLCARLLLRWRLHRRRRPGDGEDAVAAAPA